jgi:hypothetical protein
VIAVTASGFAGDHTAFEHVCRAVRVTSVAHREAYPMFEQELEMEKRASSIVPLLLIVALGVLIVGSIGYWVMQSRQVLSQQQAVSEVTAVLKAQGPTTVRFYTGLLTPSVNEKATDPHYKLLEKGGYLKLEKAKKSDVVKVALTEKAEKELPAFPEFQKRKLSDGTEQLTVALAQRKLLEVSKVTMNGPRAALVEYTWKWEPTPVGDLFDASGTAMKNFNIWDTQKLIEKYGANFYHANPAAASVRLTKDDKGQWNLSRD